MNDLTGLVREVSQNKSFIYDHVNHLFLNKEEKIQDRILKPEVDSRAE